uniref:Uncharacterized protein n=1 Tax=Steinernema glaseri TaxID=37863 RepID=A0A1I8A2K4_9BILA
MGPYDKHILKKLSVHHSSSRRLRNSLKGDESTPGYLSPGISRPVETTGGLQRRLDACQDDWRLATTGLKCPFTAEERALLLAPGASVSFFFSSGARIEKVENCPQNPPNPEQSLPPKY